MILVLLPPSAFRGRRQHRANSSVAQRSIDACSQVAGERLEVRIIRGRRCTDRRGIELSSNVSEPRSEPFDLSLEFLVGVDAVQQQWRVLGVGQVWVGDNRGARQRTDKPESRALPFLVPWPRCRVRTQFSVSRKGSVHAHCGLPEAITSASLPYDFTRLPRAFVRACNEISVCPLNSPPPRATTLWLPRDRCHRYRVSISRVATESAEPKR